MHFAFSNLFRNLRKFRVISKNKMKLSNSKTGLLLELKTYCCLSQNRRAWISSQASGALFAPLFSSSPVISWRTGSVSTSVQTMRNISASKSLISLCLWMISPPCRQTIAWSTVNKSPHVHMAGRSAISQPYLSLIASLNSRTENCSIFFLFSFCRSSLLYQSSIV